MEDSHIQVEPYFQIPALTDEKAAPSPERTLTDDDDNKTATGQDQDKKTVSNIMAELLSSGYALGDQVLAKGIEFDHQYGVRDTVQHYYDQIRHNLQQWDEQYHVSEKANEVEQRMGLQEKQKEVSEKAHEWLQNTPTGQKVSGLITQFSQQISDLHNEAKRLVVSIYGNQKLIFCWGGDWSTLWCLNSNDNRLSCRLFARMRHNPNHPMPLHRNMA